MSADKAHTPEQVEGRGRAGGKQAGRFKAPTLPYLVLYHLGQSHLSFLGFNFHFFFLGFSFLLYLFFLIFSVLSFIIGKDHTYLIQ